MHSKCCVFGIILTFQFCEPDSFKVCMFVLMCLTLINTVPLNYKINNDYTWYHIKYLQCLVFQILEYQLAYFQSCLNQLCICKKTECFSYRDGCGIHVSRLLMEELAQTIPYSGLISRGEIFVDWIVKTFRGFIFEDYNWLACTFNHPAGNYVPHDWLMIQAMVFQLAIFCDSLSAIGPPCRPFHLENC